jgi:hypothetical protein
VTALTGDEVRLSSACGIMLLSRAG